MELSVSWTAASSHQHLDLGAVEFQGTNAEIDLAFCEDIDFDGYSVGVEPAIGSNPSVADFDHPNRLRVLGVSDAGAPILQFGYPNGNIQLIGARTL